METGFKNEEKRIKNGETKNINARQIAVRILTRVEKEGSYANVLLRENLFVLDDIRERHFASSLVNGVLKNKLLLDFALRKHLVKPMSALPHEVRAVLRSGALQILFMDKVPVPAAINEAVNIVKSWGHLKNHAYPALVNSILRKTAESGWQISWPDPDKEAVKYLSVRYSHPDWLVKRWLLRWGRQETEELLKANNQPAPTTIRVNTLKTSREELKKRLADHGVKLLESARVPEAGVLHDFEAVEKLEEFRAGLFTVQDESSQLVAHALGVKPGDRVLDTCSAPGGKTTHMAQLMKNTGQIVAVDIHSSKLKLIDTLADRLGIDIIRTLESDARELKGVEGRFNRVLVDAPCSGLGVIRRRADLRWQKKEEEMEKLPQLQLAILLKASEYVACGGELIYSTCTTEPEENFEVVKAFRQLRPEFKTVDLSASLPFPVTEEKDRQQLQKGVWQILPHRHGMDGFFMAKLCLKP